MPSTLSHQGYTGSVEFEDGVYHGRVLGIADVINDASDTREGLDAEFRISLEDYIAYCNERGQEPLRPTGERDQ